MFVAILMLTEKGRGWSCCVCLVMWSGCTNKLVGRYIWTDFFKFGRLEICGLPTLSEWFHWVANGFPLSSSPRMPCSFGSEFSEYSRLFYQMNFYWHWSLVYGDRYCYWFVVLLWCKRTTTLGLGVYRIVYYDKFLRRILTYHCHKFQLIMFKTS